MILICPKPACKRILNEELPRSLCTQIGRTKLEVRFQSVFKSAYFISGQQVCEGHICEKLVNLNATKRYSSAWVNNTLSRMSNISCVPSFTTDAVFNRVCFQFSLLNSEAILNLQHSLVSGGTHQPSFLPGCSYLGHVMKRLFHPVASEEPL